MKDWNGKAAVITGGANGVGKALAKRLAREGARVLICDIERSVLDVAVNELCAAGGDVAGEQLDVSDRDAVFAMADSAFARFGTVDAVFNNAGVGGGGGMVPWAAPEQAYRWAMDVNYFGPLYGMQAFMPRMLEQPDGSIMAATSSGAGLVFPPMSFAYSASKAALIALWEMLAHTLHNMESKVHAALLFPGPHVVRTELMNSQRNVQDRYAHPDVQAGSGVNSIDSLQQMMKAMIGKEVDLTEPEDFADCVVDALARDVFWILPLESAARDALKLRIEEMLTQTGPTPPKMF
jgi:NAD(P)-dependent dehydrogenase (short-subunit alcohol dehydrogenase family)